MALIKYIILFDLSANTAGTVYHSGFGKCQWQGSATEKKLPQEHYEHE